MLGQISMLDNSLRLPSSGIIQRQGFLLVCLPHTSLLIRGIELNNDPPYMM